MILHRVIILLLVVIFNTLHSQVVFKAKLMNVNTKEEIAFGAAGFIKSGFSTLSDEKGVVKLSLNNWDNNDTLKCYAIGYKEMIIPAKKLSESAINTIELEEEISVLEEIEVSAKKLYEKKLGITRYDKRNCSGFIGLNNNWKGVETGIRLPNNQHKLYRVKDFSFYIIKNTLNDTLVFRLNFYSSNTFYPTRNILKKPVIFKTAVKQGEVKIDLSEYNIMAYDDFYVSMECLMDKVSINDFCFAGEISEPSYVRESAFRKWKKVRGGGAAFNVTVLYSKD
jgi:hypothetical protein